MSDLDLRLILPAMLLYGVRCWCRSWLGAAKARVAGIVVG